MNEEYVSPRLIRALLIVPLSIFLVVWMTLGLALWTAMLCRAFASVAVSMTAVLLNREDPRIYVEQLRRVIAIWPLGLGEEIPTRFPSLCSH